MSLPQQIKVTLGGALGSSQAASFQVGPASVSVPNYGFTSIFVRTTQPLRVYRSWTLRGPGLMGNFVTDWFSVPNEFGLLFADLQDRELRVAIVEPVFGQSRVDIELTLYSVDGSASAVFKRRTDCTGFSIGNVDLAARFVRCESDRILEGAGTAAPVVDGLRREILRRF